MFCKNCGQELNDNASICPYCGTEVKKNEQDGQPAQPQATQAQAQPQQPYGQTYQQPQQPYGQTYQQPYGQPYQQPYAPQSYEPESNGIAIAGFICAFFIPLLGWIFGGIGLARSKRRYGKGKGFSIAALVIATVMFIINLIYLRNINLEVMGSVYNQISGFFL